MNALGQTAAARGVSVLKDMISFDSDVGNSDMSHGWANLTRKYLALLAYEKRGLNPICFRPFSEYGEDQQPATRSRVSASAFWLNGERQSFTSGFPVHRCGTSFQSRTAWMA